MSKLDSKMVQELAIRFAADPSFGAGGAFAGCGVVLVLLDPTKKRTFIGANTDELSMTLYRAVTTAFLELMRSRGVEPELDEESGPMPSTHYGSA